MAAPPNNFTNFGSLTPLQKKVWSRDVWRMARNASFVMRFAGTGPNAVIQRVTDLTKTERGDRAVIPLVNDLFGDGAMGDTQLWDQEEPLQAQSVEITFDQIRNAVRNQGRMSEQKTVIRFREMARDRLAYWMANIVDEMAFLTLAGLPWFLRTDGSVRGTVYQNGTPLGPVDGQFRLDLTTASNTAVLSRPGAPNGLSLADHASASANVDGTQYTDPVTGLPAQPPLQNGRHFLVDSAGALVESDPAGGVDHLQTTLGTLNYKALVELKAYAKSRYIRGVRGANGREYYYLFVHPKALASLKTDPQFLSAVSQAGTRGNQNPFFSGAIETVDGLVIVEHRQVPNTLNAVNVATTFGGAATGNAIDTGFGVKWGPNRNLDAQRALLVGAQALGMADLGDPTWDEQTWDYNNQAGIAISKMVGFVRPKFRSPYEGNSLVDFGVMALDTAL